MDSPTRKRLRPNDPSSSSSSGASMDSLPNDILIDILLLLPVSSLLRCRAVANPWLSLIDSPIFVSLHTDREDDSSLIVRHDLDPDFASIRFGIVSEDNLQVCKPVEFLPEVGIQKLANGGGSVTIVSSVRGIVCVLYSEEDDDEEFISLWNPATKKLALLPPPPPSGDDGNDWWINSYGFGFDAQAKDFKLVRLLVQDFVSYMSMPLKTQTTIYSSSADSWRVVDAAVPRNFYLTSNPKQPFKGSYYWLGYDQVNEDYFILTFNFTNERFGILPVPELEREGTDSNAQLSFLRERITIVDWTLENADNRVDLFGIWVLNEHENSWTKQYRITLNRADQLFGFGFEKDVSFGFSMNGKVILQNREDNLEFYLYDPLEEEEEGRVFTNQSGVLEVAVYRESLISVTSATGARKRAMYEDLLEKLQDFKVFGYERPVLPLRPEDSLQNDISHLMTVAQVQEGEIKQLRDFLQRKISFLQKKVSFLQRYLSK